MMTGDQREVEFGKYCKTCKNYDKKEDDEPCDSCLAEGANYHSAKPVKYDPKVPYHKKKKD